MLCNDYFILFLFFVVGVQTRELERPATVMIYGSKPILGVSILALYLCMADNKLNSTTTPTLSLCYPGRGDPGIIEMKNTIPKNGTRS